MIPRIRFNNHEDGRQICKTAGAIFNPFGDAVIARLDADGDCMGGAVYTGYSGPNGSIGVHFAGFHPRWINRDMLFMCFDYPFNQLGVKRMFAQVPMTNETSLRLCDHFGYRRIAVVEDVYADGDMQLFAMYRHECKYLDLVPNYAKEAPDGR